MFRLFAAAFISLAVLTNKRQARSKLPCSSGWRIIYLDLMFLPEAEQINPGIYAALYTREFLFRYRRGGREEEKGISRIVRRLDLLN